MQRVDNWKAALTQHLQALKTQPFEWGSNDCCLSAFKAVEIITGKNLVEKYQGRYSTELGSKRILAKYGHSTIKEATTELLGEPLEFPLMASAGDIALLRDVNASLALGVVFGHGIYSVGKDGLVVLPITSAEAAWRV